MSNIVFFADVYWEIHWMYNVIKAMNGVVYSSSASVKKLCDDMGITTTDDYSPYRVVVTTNMHMGNNWNICSHFIDTGGKSVILQHAWDPGLNLCDNFWAHDMNKFSYYIVGCSQDEKWLGEKYGYDRVLNLGIPKLDDLYRVKKSHRSLKHIYDTVGYTQFFLSISPTNVISNEIYRDYTEQLIPNSPIPVVFKIHPGNVDVESTRNSFLAEGKDYRIVADDLRDLDFTYKLIKASSGVICVESFLSVEASLMNKPVIFHGRNSLPSDFYNRSENINQQYRAPIEMSSSLGHPTYTDKQGEVSSFYRCDGKNTQRVVEFLRNI